MVFFIFENLFLHPGSVLDRVILLSWLQFSLVVAVKILSFFVPDLMSLSQQLTDYRPGFMYFDGEKIGTDSETNGTDGESYIVCIYFLNWDTWASLPVRPHRGICLSLISMSLMMVVFETQGQERLWSTPLKLLSGFAVRHLLKSQGWIVLWCL